MRIGIFSDMHGNNIALEAVLSDLAGEGVDQLVCLGDAVQGGPQPAEVVARLRELNCHIVMGNADNYLLTGHDDEATDAAQEAKMNEVRLWQLAQLTEDDIAFIRSFRPSVELPLEGSRKLICFHGSPRSFNDIILPNSTQETLSACLGGFAPHLLAGGHTHVQQIHHFRDNFYFGVGSAGYAYRHDQDTNVPFRADPFAEYAVLTVLETKVRLEFRRVFFDVDELIKCYQASGRPYGKEAVEQYR